MTAERRLVELVTSEAVADQCAYAGEVGTREMAVVILDAFGAVPSARFRHLNTADRMALVVPVLERAFRGCYLAAALHWAPMTPEQKSLLVRRISEASK